MTRRHCLTLDLNDDPALLADYERYHQKISPEITRSITDSGIQLLEIYRPGTPLFTIMEGTATFSFDVKKCADEANPKVREWEKLMWQFQQSLP